MSALPDRPLRNQRAYLFLGQTTSLCEACLGLVPAKILQVDDQIYYEKRCRDHGVTRTLVSTDADYFKATRSYLKPGDRPLKTQSRTHYGCPYDCGLCPDHEQHSCIAIIEINDYCNLTCPVCFAGSSPLAEHKPVSDIAAMVDHLVASEGEPDVVQISGGEPTYHPNFLEIVRMAKERPIRHLMINTNGVRIARDPEFVAELAELKRGLEIYLQFDSFERDVLMQLRGADLRRVRRDALDALERHGISTTLVSTIKKGVNDHELGRTVDFALEYSCIRGVTFQPIQDAGRNADFDKNRDRIMLTDIRGTLIEECDVFSGDDLIPLPCNPEMICVGYGIRNGRDVVPVTSFLPHDVLVSAVPNTMNFEQYPELRSRVEDFFSLATTEMTADSRLGDLLCCLPKVPIPDGLGYENIFRLAIVQFMDAFNFCVGGVKRSCIHFVTPAGQIIPFDTYNLFYRDGSIDRIWAQLDDAWRGVVAP